ncbi:alpha/beta fold hydrolase [Marinobacter sp.]|uniref:alpha/beta fold hydrolase n=1 Tax=Marinobacter sp. TaxID=50741 RepID=UPI00384C0CCB
MQVNVQNGRIYVARDGKGSPALLLHGVPDSAELWQPVIDGIRDHYTCYAPDLPGFYRSQVPSGFDYSLEGYATFVKDLLDALGIEQPVTLILHDWGGIFGMAFACLYPERVSRIVGGSFPFSHLYQWHPWARVWQTPVLGELSMAMMNEPLFRWEIQRGSQRLDKSQIHAMYAGRATRPETRNSVLRLYRSMPPRRFQPWQSRVELLARKVPIDLVWGADDPYVPTYQGRLLHPRRMHVVPECGHWVPAEAPEAIIAAVLETDIPETTAQRTAEQASENA